MGGVMKFIRRQNCVDGRIGGGNLLSLLSFPRKEEKFTVDTTEGELCTRAALLVNPEPIVCE